MADTKNGPLCTPYENPACPTHSAGDSSLGGSRGGYTLPGAPTETANMSELGPLPTTVAIEGAPGPDTTVEPAQGVTAPGVPITTFGQK